MNKLWFLFIPILILTGIAQSRTKKLVEDGKKGDRFFTFVIIIVLTLFCGLRTFYNDTVTYRLMYEILPDVNQYISSPNYTLANGWGFGLVGSFLKQIGCTFQDYLMIFALLTVPSYVLFVKRYCSNYFLLGVFLMFTTGFYSFTFAAMKQCAATAICISALPLAEKKKWIPYLLLVILGALFHPYSVVYFIVPLMMFKPFTNRTYLYITAFIIAGFALDSLLGTVLNVTDMMGASYTEEEFTGEGVNAFRVIVSFVPLAMGMFYRHTLFEDSEPGEDMMFNLAMMNALIMFVGIFGTANYFGRLANYFLPAQVAVLPWMLNKINEDDSKILKPLCVVGYMGYFMYDNMIRHVFDQNFAQTDMIDYFDDLVSRILKQA